MNNVLLQVLSAVVFLLLHIGQCYGNKVCDKSRHYLIVDKNGKVIECNQCYKCKPGKEPVPSCGAFVGITEVLGKCHPCKDGFYSGNDDMLPCQACKSLECLKVHLKVGGECKINKPDTSYCTGECEEGYLMNSNETACEPYKPRQRTTKTPDKTVDSTTSKGNEESDQSLLVVYILCGVFPVIVVVCYCLYSRRIKAQVVLKGSVVIFVTINKIISRHNFNSLLNMLLIVWHLTFNLRQFAIIIRLVLN